jgi:hypothetical protein
MVEVEILPPMNTTTTASARSSIKSVPVQDLEIVAIVHVVKGWDETIEEVEVLDKNLRDAATFGAFEWRCDCCGHRLAYACEVVHKPTMRGYHIGRDCAASIQSLANRNFDHLSVALAHRAKARANVASWKNRHPEHREIIDWALNDPKAHYIARDIAGKVARYAEISDKQIELVYRLRQQQIDKDAAAAAEPKPTAPIEEGRREITGTVLGTKVVESEYGTTVKLLVRLSCLNKVWMSRPAGFAGGRGDSITCKVTIQRSNDDPHFGFGSRPKMA